jgi:hypothetical protein
VEENAGLPFGFLFTQIILQSRVNVTGEPKMKIKQPLSKQTSMKSNAKLQRADSDDEMPIAATMPVGFPNMASSSQTAPPSELEVNYSQIMEVTMSSMQQEIHSINLRVEQNQLDLQECLKFHHPSSSDDEDDADRTIPLPEDV